MIPAGKIKREVRDESFLNAKTYTLWGRSVYVMKKRMSIRNFIITWTIGLGVCFAYMAAMFLWSTNMLQEMNEQIYKDSLGLELTRRLEAAILGERRENLLWRDTGNKQHLDRQIQLLAESSQLISDMDRYITTGDEKNIAAAVRTGFQEYRTTAVQPVPLETISRITDDLLQDIDRFGEQNRKQMAATVSRSETLNRRVDLLSAIFIVLAGLGTALAAYILLNRIFQPVMALARAAGEFGRGDFSVRVRVFRDDELGGLCETFNHMAGGIEEMERDRTHLAAAVAHDLKNPLLVIGGAARRIRRKAQLEPEYAQWIDRIIHQVNTIEHYVADLIDSMRIESGHMELNTEPVDLVELVQNVQKLYDELSATHRIEFHAQGECIIQGDAERLERVITNLISNAIKYSPDDTTVRVSVSQSLSRAAVIISDQGPGIPQNEIRKLFKPFQRLDQTRTMARGSGLGLFSTKKIVEGHGGQINIASRPGEGATVEISLPPAPDTSASDTPGKDESS